MVSLARQRHRKAKHAADSFDNANCDILFLQHGALRREEWKALSEEGARVQRCLGRHSSSAPAPREAQGRLRRPMATATRDE